MKMSDFKREDRYIVLKRRDVKNALTDLEQDILSMIQYKISKYRVEIMDKDNLRCVVVEEDWPEYEKIWDMIEERVKSE